MTTYRQKQTNAGDVITLLVIIIICLYVGYQVLWSGAPLWVKIPVGAVLGVLVLGAFDALIAITGREE